MYIGSSALQQRFVPQPLMRSSRQQLALKGASRSADAGDGQSVNGFDAGFFHGQSTFFKSRSGCHNIVNQYDAFVFKTFRVPDAESVFNIGNSGVTAELHLRFGAAVANDGRIIYFYAGQLAKFARD